MLTTRLDRGMNVFDLRDIVQAAIDSGQGLAEVTMWVNGRDSPIMSTDLTEGELSLEE